MFFLTVPKTDTTDEKLTLLSSEEEADKSSWNKEPSQNENVENNCTSHESFSEDPRFTFNTDHSDEIGHPRTNETESLQSVFETDDGSESNEYSDDNNSDLLDDTDSADSVSSDDDACSVNNEQCESAQCSGSDMEKYCPLALLSFAMKYNLAGKCIDDLVLLYKSTSPQSKLWLPNNYKQLLEKTVFPGRQNYYTQHHYCMYCLELFPADNPNEYKCKTRGCKGLRYIGPENDQLDKTRKVQSFFVLADVRSQLKMILGKPHVWQSILDTKSRVLELQDKSHTLTDITDGESYKKVSKPGSFLDPRCPNVSVMFNTDGIPLYSSSKVKLWPIFMVINELPPVKRFVRGNAVLAGLWQGKCDVPFIQYLSAFGRSMNELHETGIDFVPHGSSMSINTKVAVLIGCVDLQAKAYIANMTAHNGQFGCLTCEEPGKSVKSGKGSCRCYPYRPEHERHPFRTTESINLSAEVATPKKRIKGVCGPSGLQYLPSFDFVTGIVPDYMHGVLLGVTKALLYKWLSPTCSKEPYFVGDKVSVISGHLKDISPPDYVERLPRDLEKHYLNLKATELQSWLLYYAIPCLRGILPDLYLEHFCLLSEGIHILLKDHIDSDDLLRAEYLLENFYEEFSQLYGENSCGLNVHNTCSHLVFYVRQWGPLFGWNCFAFEDFNAQILGYAHGTGDVTNQIIKRHMASLYVSNVNTKAIDEESVSECISKLTKRNDKSVKTTIQAVNCCVAGAEQKLMVDDTMKLFLLTQCHAGSIDHLKKILRISLCREKFYGIEYRKIRKRHCCFALTDSGNIVKILYFVRNVQENYVYAVCNTVETDPIPHIFPFSGHHIFVVNLLDDVIVIPANKLCQKVFFVEIGQTCYVTKAPNLFGYSVLR